MSRLKNLFSRKAIVMTAGAALLCSSAAHADTLVTKDGRHFTGEITQRDQDYVIKTRFGEVHVSLNDFDHIDKNDAPSTPATPAPRTTVATATPATPRATVPTKHAVDPKTLDALLKQGRDALSAGEYKAARDAFSDAVAAADKDVDALHGLAVAYMYLGDFTHARDPMEKAFAAAGPAKASRALVLNMCVCQIGVHNPMRGAKAVMDYLTAHKDPLDEPMLNAMGTALNVSDAQAKKQSLFQQCLQFYIVYNAKLEAANPGYKRWGVDWRPAAEVERKNQKNGDVDRELARLDGEIDTLNRTADKQQHDADLLADLVKRGYRPEFMLQQARDALTDTQKKRAELQKQYDAEAVKRDPQPFPRAMTLVAMDDLTPPPVGGQTAVASATGPLFPGLDDKPATPSKKPAKKVGSGNTMKSDGGTASTETPTPPETPQITIAAQPAPKKNVRVTSYAAAFPVADHLILTAAAPVEGATEIMLQAADGTPIKATLVRADPATGLALLRVTDRKFLPIPLATTFTGGAVSCAAYPSVNIFNPAAETINGSAKPPAAATWNVTLTRHPRLGGAPLLSGNKLIGVELASRDNEPANIPAATLDQVRAFLGSDAPPPSASTGPDPLNVVLQLNATRESTGG